MCSLPVIVGGGIHSTEKLIDVLVGGADLVVIGNHFEKHPNELRLFISIVKGFANHQSQEQYTYG